MKHIHTFQKAHEDEINKFFKDNEGKFMGANMMNSDKDITFILDDDFRKTQMQTELEGARHNLCALIAAQERAMNANEVVRMSLSIMRRPQGITESQQEQWNKNFQEAKERNEMTRVNIQNTLAEKKAELNKVDEQIEELMKDANHKTKKGG